MNSIGCWVTDAPATDAPVDTDAPATDAPVDTDAPATDAPGTTFHLQLKKIDSQCNGLFKNIVPFPRIPILLNTAQVFFFFIAALITSIRYS